MLKFFRLPFATTGDKTAVPDAVDSNGNVSYSQGYGFDYQRQKTDPAAKNIERDKMNQVLFDITTAIAEIQSQGAPDYITSALNGGTAYSYAQYAIVKYSGALYISLVAANTALPSDATKWALLPTPALLQQAAYIAAVAGGTVDAITAAFSPAIAALPAAPGTLAVLVRAAGANATTTPTFKADGTTAKTIVKGNNVPLVAGDIAGAGHWLELQYDATLDKWVLQNPTYNFGGTPAQFDNSLKTSTTAFVQRALGNFSAYTIFNTNQVLTNLGFGSVFESSGSSSLTLQLPAASACPAGCILVYNGQSAGTLTVSAAGGIFYGPNNPGGTSTVVLYFGQQVEFVSDGTNWKAVNGAGSFVKTSTTNGHARFSNGLIMQFGQGTFASGGTVTQAQSFPVAFPNECLTVNMGSWENADNNDAPVQFRNQTTTGFTAYCFNSTAGATGYSFVAFGR